MSKETVTIHIDKEKYVSPDPTTGEALYTLGHVDVAIYDLWRKVTAKGDDELIQNNSNSVDLKNGVHFYTAKKDLNPGNGRK